MDTEKANYILLLAEAADKLGNALVQTNDHATRSKINLAMESVAKEIHRVV